MNYAYLNGVAALVVMLWAVWCVVVPGIVREGLGGQIVFCALGLSAFAIMVHGFMGEIWPPAEVAFNACMAALVVRHWWLRVGAPLCIRKRQQWRNEREGGP